MTQMFSLSSHYSRASNRRPHARLHLSVSKQHGHNLHMPKIELTPEPHGKFFTDH